MLFGVQVSRGCQAFRAVRFPGLFRCLLSRVFRFPGCRFLPDCKVSGAFRSGARSPDCFVVFCPPFFFPKARGKTNPAPGLRGHGDGSLWNISDEGSVWSAIAASNSTYGLYLYFNTADVNPVLKYYRAFGFQLRCLSE